jgi:hypothetical protein
MDEQSCDCCEGTQILTPVTITNRPGLSALAYRAGTHARFFETMKARLSSQIVEVPHDDDVTQHDITYPLRDLATRAPDDASIALLDGWATVADVLTFYQQRIANEGYLRTATERRSVLELARLVGYALRPGVASTVYLAYTIDPNHKVPTEIPVGTRSQSVPNPGELPQSFETSEVLDARASWNILQPRLTQPMTYTSIFGDADQGLAGSGKIYLKGVGVNVKPNDPLLFVGGATPQFVRVKTVEPDPKNDRTIITLPPEVVFTPTAVQKQPERAALPSSELAQALRAVATRYRNAADFNADPRSEMAGRVVRVLDDLQANAKEDMPAAELAALVRGRHLPQIQEELATAADSGYNRLQGWLDALVTALDEVLAAASAPATAIAASLEMSQPAAAASSDEPPPDELRNVIIGLSKPPSVPPPNTLQLKRSVDKSFAASNDSGLQVVNALRPDFKTILPVALANVQVTSTNPLEVYALRLKTGVYGNTAPLKPITDNQGKVIGTQEWPINGALTVGVELRIVSTNLTGAIVSVAAANIARTEAIQLSSSQTTDVPDVGGVDFHFDPTSQYKDAYHIRYNRDNVRLIYKRIDDASSHRIEVTIQVSDKQSGPFSIDDGGTLSVVVRSHNFKFTSTLSQFGYEGGISVTDEAPLPPSPRDIIALDGTYDQVVPGSWYVVTRLNAPQNIGLIKDAQTVAKTDYNFPAKVTQLTLAKNWLTDQDLLLSDIRSTSVFAQSEALELAEEPIATEICGGEANEIELDDLYSDLKSGRWLIVVGNRSDIKTRSIENAREENVVADLESAELVMLAGVRHGYNPDLPGDTTHTFITLATKLSYCYGRDKVTIYGNVVKATHGETRNEILGNGDGSRALQSFDLKQPPLTYVAAPNPAGVDSTLHVYVNDVEWREAPDLVSLSRTDHKFITRTNDEGKTTAIFGNGQQGSRLPTGAANVRAVYRNGIGKPGNVLARQISLLVSRPLGVKDVINPLRASGGTDKEARDQARKNVPLAVTALDRLVSVQDYADFTRTFAGIAKASAQRISDGRRELVHVTIAGVDDVPIDPSSDLYRNLGIALRTYGDPDLPVQIDLRELLMLVISAKVYLQADYVWEKVVSQVRAKLLDAFSFDRRELGQDAVLSEALAVMQAVRGVVYVDVDIFGGIPEKTTDMIADEQGVLTPRRRLLTPKEIGDTVGRLIHPPEDAPPQPQDRIPVNLAGMTGSVLQPAQLAFLSPLVPDTLILNRG